MYCNECKNKCVPNIIMLGQTAYAKSVTKILHTTQYFSDPGGPLGQCLTVAALFYQPAKFRLLRVRLRDICCQISLISLTTRPTDKHTNQKK